MPSSLCPVLVERDDQLASLESALMSAHRGEGGLAVLSGEAGIGKTRLANELARLARQLGSAVLWGSCSEAELSLPYLPFVEALGNYLDGQSSSAVGERLGPTRRELSQLFPQLADSAPPAEPGDSEQAKLRLFEAIVCLLAIPADDQGLLLVIEDVHWADESTRELLDHLARRISGLRALVLITYRSDELHRRHPFVPTLQGWRRSGLAEVVELKPLADAGVGEMLQAILGSDRVDPELRELMTERTEGNPFVLEEMLKEATEGGAAPRPGGSVAVDRATIPETVRDTILLRLARLAPEHVGVLEAAAVLGRTFDYPTLVAIAQSDEQTVQSALAEAVAQQLVEEHPERPGSYRWRHALTQEAIYTDTVTPRRQAIHARAADVLSQREDTAPVDLAHHLLGAGRLEEAVPVCLASAEDAERTAAFGEAIGLLERILPHLSDPKERAFTVSRIGRDHWLNGASAMAARYLREGIESLEALGERAEAARFRVVLGRCDWENSRPDLAREEFETARDVLETAGPSAELALAHMRLAGLDAFELDYAGCLAEARTAMAIAEQAGAEFERVWARGFVALGLIDSGDLEAGLELVDVTYEEAVANEFWQIASNIAWNDIWTRVHTMNGGLEQRLKRLEGRENTLLARGSHALAASYVRTALGELERARAAAAEATETYDRLGSRKMAWRGEIQEAQALTELGRYDEAAMALPAESTRTELQDIVYDSPARIRLALARGEIDEALRLASQILENAVALATYRETLALAAEAFLAAGRISEAEELLELGRVHPTPTGAAFVDEMDGRIRLARGDAEGAIAPLRRFVEAARAAGFRLAELRGRVLLARARGGAGDCESVERELNAVADAADGIQARLVRAEADDVASSLGVSLAPAPEAEGGDVGADFLAVGERLVTSMFADVRGYSELLSTEPPAELGERMAMLFRFARTAVEGQGGLVDKFAGDAVMATFNVTGVSVDHCISALAAAITLRDRAEAMGLGVGIGIAVGPAVLAKGSDAGNLTVRGVATNLASRLQAKARRSEVLLSDEAYRRVEDWLAQRGIAAERETLELKGFAEPQPAYRISSPSAAR
ncbi:MAG: AAA family ATPase [Solirubrobacterales bacterium]